LVDLFNAMDGTGFAQVPLLKLVRLCKRVSPLTEWIGHLLLSGWEGRRRTVVAWPKSSDWASSVVLGLLAVLAMPQLTTVTTCYWPCQIPSPQTDQLPETWDYCNPQMTANVIQQCPRYASARSPAVNPHRHQKGRKVLLAFLAFT